MTSIGELVVNLKVKSEKQKVDDFNKSIKNTQGFVRQLRNSFATLNFATRIFSKVFDETINRATRFGGIERFAKSVNASASSIKQAEDIVERLGISGSSVEAVLSTIENLNQSIRRGGTEQTKAINKYQRWGITAVDSAGEAIDAQKQFNNVLERAKELPAEARREFDRQFAGGKGLLNLTNEQLDLLKFQNVSNASQQMAEDLSKLNVEWNELKSNFSNLAEDLSGPGSKLFQAVNFLISSQSGMLRSFTSFIVDDLSDEQIKTAEQMQAKADESLKELKAILGFSFLRTIFGNRIFKPPPGGPPPAGGASLSSSVNSSLSKGAAGLSKSLSNLTPNLQFNNLPRTSDLLTNVSVNNNVNVNVDGSGGDGQTIGDVVEHKLNKVLGDINRDLARMLYSNQERE